MYSQEYLNTRKPDAIYNDWDERWIIYVYTFPTYKQAWEFKHALRCNLRWAMMDATDKNRLTVCEKVPQ